jgi:hypothetical protein
MIYDIIAWIIIASAFAYSIKRVLKVVGLFTKDVNPCSICANTDCQLKNLKNIKSDIEVSKWKILSPKVCKERFPTFAK